MAYVDGISEEHDANELMLDEESLQLGLLETVLKASLILASIIAMLYTFLVQLTLNICRMNLRYNDNDRIT